MRLGETLLLWKSKDMKCCLYKTPYVAVPVRVLDDVIVKPMPYEQIPLDAPTRTRNFSWFTIEEFFKRPVLSYQDSYVIFLWGGLRAKVVPERTTYSVTWGVSQRVPSSVSSSILCSDASSWAEASGTLKIKLTKGTLGNQPQFMRVTPSVLLGSWVLQPIKDVTSLRTNLKTHAKWQGSVEEPAAKDFVVRKVRTIELNEVQGTHWSANKCKERLGNCPEAVVRQATIILYSRVWKSLGDSLPKLYCIDLAEANVTQESVSWRMLCEKKRYDLWSPNGCLHEKPMAKGKTGKENQY